MRPQALRLEPTGQAPLPASRSDRCERAATDLAAAREHLRANEVPKALERLRHAQAELAAELSNPLGWRICHERAIAELASRNLREALWHLWYASGIYLYDGPRMAERWWILGRLRWLRGELPGAEIALRQAAGRFRALGDPRSEIWVWIDLGGLATEVPVVAPGASDEIAREFQEVERQAREPDLCRRLLAALESEPEPWPNLRRLQRLAGAGAR